MNTTSLHYDFNGMVQDALRSVVRNVLQRVEKEGLRGDHHFYIAFRTGHPGVKVPDHLREKYPEEMTIVLQHRFWGLNVEDDHFEVGLSFNQKREHLIIPLAAIVGFVDPSAQFALQFEDGPAGEDEKSETLAPVPLAADSQTPGTEKKGTDASDNDSKVVAIDAFRNKSS